MRVLALRAVLAGLLLATVGGKVLRTGATQPDVHSKVMALIALNGGSPRDVSADPSDPLGRGIRFQEMGCEGVARIFFVDLGLQVAPMLDRVIGPGYTWYIAYLGRTWITRDRLGLRLEWLKQRTLSVLGLGEYVVNEVALVIAHPSGCHVNNTIDWSAVWRRSSIGVQSDRQHDARVASKLLGTL
jgi:hypothetical protein